MPYDAPVSKPTELAQNAEQAGSLYSANDMRTGFSLTKSRDELLTSLPKVEINESAEIRIKELLDPNPKDLSKYGAEFASLLKPEMEPAEVLEMLRNFTRENQKGILSSVAGLHTSPIAAVEYEFNKALKGSGYYIDADYLTHTAALMKDESGGKEDAIVGGFRLWSPDRDHLGAINSTPSSSNFRV